MLKFEIMCYDASYAGKDPKEYAKRYSKSKAVEKEMEESFKNLKLQATYHANAFSLAPLPVITNESDQEFQAFDWGLIPSWAKDPAGAMKIARGCLNARGETIFEKPAFRSASKSKRCLIIVDGGFEHHHQDGATYPFHFKLKNNDPMTFAGLWEKWVHKDIVKYTCTIVTTKANELLAKIHNNPKAKEPRMPVILPKELEWDWLNPINDPSDKQLIQELIQPFDADLMTAYPVRKLRGKEAVGNKPQALERYDYEQLKLKF